MIIIHINELLNRSIELIVILVLLFLMYNVYVIIIIIIIILCMHCYGYLYLLKINNIILLHFPHIYNDIV